MKNWRLLKEEFSPTTTTLLIKNKTSYKLLNFKLLKKNSIPLEIINLLQGSTLLVACNSHQEMIKSFDLILKKNGAPLLGGLYHQKLVNHLDLKKLMEVDDSIHSVLWSSLKSRAPYFLNFSLNYQQYKLLFLLKLFASTRKQKN
jgi:hypothetical protein